MSGCQGDGCQGDGGLTTINLIFRVDGCQTPVPLTPIDSYAMLPGTIIINVNFVCIHNRASVCGKISSIYRFPGQFTIKII